MLEAVGLVRRFGERQVVAGIDLAIAAGESVALMGPSGCGKTTLLQMLGLLDRPDGGTVKIDGHDAWQASNAIRCELRLTRLGFVFQQNNLLEALTARENIAIVRWRAGSSRGEGLRDADALLERFGLTARARANAGELSLGEAQRVAIARALVNKPHLVLADEPTGSLDAESATMVMDALLGAEVAVLVVTHDPDIAARARRTVRMRGGKLV